MKPLEKRRKLTATALRLLAAQVTALLWMGGLTAPAQEPAPGTDTNQPAPPVQGLETNPPAGPAAEPPMNPGPDQGPPPEQGPAVEEETNRDSAPASKPAVPAAVPQVVVLPQGSFPAMVTNQSAAPVGKKVATATTNPPAALEPRTVGGVETNPPAELARQETEAGAGTGLQAYKIVYERNIFNPNRGPRYSRRNGGDAPKPVKVEGFSLVGTLMSEKGAYAFFDGSDSQYRAALQTSNTIAGYTLTGITPNFVTLRSPSNAFDLTMNMQMRKQEEGDWELLASTGSWNSTNSASSTNATVSDEEGGNDPTADEVMKRLMKKREEELKK
jgi:hypothetical protein